MSQPTLFDAAPEVPAHCQSQSAPAASRIVPAPISRLSDPQTSQQAAADIAPLLGKAKQGFLSALTRLGAPATASEIAAEAAQSAGSTLTETYRKRAGELVRSGHIEQREPRLCRVTGKLATTYKLA